MRATIEFHVQGDSYYELEDRALETYRKLMDDEEASLPFSTTIDISPEMASASMGSSKLEILYWEGIVTVVHSANQGGA